MGVATEMSSNFLIYFWWNRLQNWLCFKMIHNRKGLYSYKINQFLLKLKLFIFSNLYLISPFLFIVSFTHMQLQTILKKNSIGTSQRLLQLYQPSKQDSELGAQRMREGQAIAAAWNHIPQSSNHDWPGEIKFEIFMISIMLEIKHQMQSADFKCTVPLQSGNEIKPNQ